MKQSEWMEGLLWAENYVEKYGVTFLTQYAMNTFNTELDCEFSQAVWDYIKYYKERVDL